jgi:hypothetical protein
VEVLISQHKQCGTSIHGLTAPATQSFPILIGISAYERWSYKAQQRAIALKSPHTDGLTDHIQRPSLFEWVISFSSPNHPFLCLLSQTNSLRDATRGCGLMSDPARSSVVGLRTSFLRSLKQDLRHYLPAASGM